ncbi:ABC transporter permease [Hufsiella ginkgonis]|uniref:FtsX-like permease family protein n=1 Tax=Hufsiella ginkgonis TaxID=2695274 RepID=A0A7K1XVN2_9SPHI|nr:ABC transporter permease [Hufsiella ginkgonis]MXV15053.1 FtsX-like permease family protein [Hufsiella ginkgonis]
MNKLDLKIAIRTFLNGKWYNFLNLSGLALGFAAFMFVALYVDHETGYDEWNRNVDRIFLVERETPNGPSPYTPGKLAAAVKSQCPEVEETGRMNTALFQLPFYTSAGRFLVTKWVGADYSIAGMLGIKPEGFKLTPGTAPAILLSRKTAGVLFPGERDIRDKTVNMLSRSGMPMTVAGVAAAAPGNTNFSFDCIGFSDDITEGKDQGYANQIYQTFLLVKPGADIALLSKKIDQVYKEAALADGSRVDRESLSSAAPAIYLDPLANLHLKPHYGSPANNQVVKGLTILAVIVLVVTGINFTNLYVAQANRRSKEVGIKKVNGILKRQVITQFLLEIFFQCLLALAFAFVIVVVGLPYFNRLLGADLLVAGINLKIILQLVVSLVTLTLLAGVYPAIVMAGFRPVTVLRGEPLANGGKFSWISGSITTLQFAFAAGFVIVLVVINRQVDYMRSGDPGFSAKQVIYIDNLGIYNDPLKFEPVRRRIQAIPGVKQVTVTSHIPGGIIPGSSEYTTRNKAYPMHTIAVDHGYFEMLNIALKEGRSFSSPGASDTANAVINETAARQMGLKNAIGSQITGCGGTYQVIGVTKDVKANGFETQIQPTIYLMGGACGLLKTQIMVSADAKAIPGMLQTLNAQWGSINKLDGDSFSYHFLDELYGRLFIKQAQLRSVLLCFSLLAIFISSLGFFASAANTIRLRMKEIVIRKVLGASSKQLTVTLSKPFFYCVIIANAIAWPFSFVVATKWLETFAYRATLSFAPFVFALAISLLMVAVTVCLQIARAVRFKAAVKLKV